MTVLRVPIDLTRMLVDEVVADLKCPKMCLLCSRSWDEISDREAHFAREHLTRAENACKRCVYSSRSLTRLRIHLRGHGVSVNRMREWKDLRE